MPRPSRPSSRPRLCRTRILAGSIAACLGSLFAASDARAAVYTWDGDGTATTGISGGMGNWDLGTANWFTTGPDNVAWPNTTPNTDEAIFGVLGGAVSLGAPINVNKLTFNVGGYTIDNGGVAANTLKLDGTTPTITVTNTGDSAGISTVLTGTAGFTKAGLGTLSLSGTTANSYTGTATVNAGTLELNHSLANGAITGALTLGGGTVKLMGNEQIANTSVITLTAGALDLNGFSETAGTLTANGGTFTSGAGTLTLSSTAATVLSLRNVNLQGHLALTGASGGGVTFDAAGAAAGTISGNLDLGAVSRTITVNDVASVSPDLTISGVLGGAGWTKAGTGNLQLSGASGNTFTGTLTFNSGNLFLGKTSGNAISGNLSVVPAGTAQQPAVILLASNQIADNATVTLQGVAGAGGGHLDLSGFDETLSGLTIINAQSSGSVTIQTGGATGGGTLKLQGDVTISGSSTATTISAPTGITGNRIGGVSASVTAANVGTLDLDGAVRSFNITATGNAVIGSKIANGGLSKIGTTNLTLENAANSFSGGVTVNGGSLIIAATGALPAGNNFRVTSGTLSFLTSSFTTNAGGITIGGGAAASTSAISTSTGTLTLGGNVAYDSTNNPGTATISGKLDLGGANRTFDVPDSTGTATDLTVSAVVSGTGFGLTKTSGGVLTLSGINTFTGPLAIQGGQVVLSGTSNQFGGITVASGATLLASSDAQLGAAGQSVQLDGGTLMNSSNSAQIAPTHPIIIGALGGTLNNATGTNGGRILLSTADMLRGSGPLTKAGANAAGGSSSTLQITTAQNNFTGAITLTGGFIEANANVLQNASSITIDPASGQLAEFVTNAGTTPNNIVIKGGSISVDNGNGAFSGTIDFQGAGAIRLNDFFAAAGTARLLSITGKVTGAGAITVGSTLFTGAGATNTGTLTLTNDTNDFSGGITVQKALSLTAQAADGAGSTLSTGAITLAGGKLNLRDDGTGSNLPIAYGNNVTVTADAGTGTTAGAPTIDVNRAGATATGNTFQLGTLSIGGQTLAVSGANGYGLAFQGLSTLTGSPTFNVSGTTLTLAGGISGAGQTYTKTGNGTLRVLGSSDAAFVLSAGTLELATEPTGLHTLLIPAGTGFSAGYAATQANLIDHIDFASAGVVALGVDSTFNPDFTGFSAGLRLGGTANATLTGTITPAADNIVRLGGGGGTLTLGSANALTGARSLDVNTNGTTAGAVVLANSNNYTGATSVGGGMILRIASDAALGSTTGVALDNGTLQLTNGGDFATFNTRSLTIGTNGGTLDTNGADTILGTALGGTGVFSKTGPGALTLSNTVGTFAGKTAIKGGVLAISDDKNLGLAPATAVTDQLQLLGGTLQVTAPIAIATTRGISTGGVGGTIDVGANAVTYGGILTGTAPLNITGFGAGKFTVSASPTLAATTNVNGGLLEIVTPTAWPNQLIQVNSGGTLRISSGSSAISDAGDIVLNSGGTFEYNSTSETMDLLTGNGTLTRTASGAGTLAIGNGDGNFTFGGAVTEAAGTLNLTKTGAGIGTFTGTHTALGTFLVNEGKALFNTPTASLNAAAVNVGDGNGGGEALTMGAVGDVWTNGPLNRLSNTANVTVNATTTGGFTYIGPAAGSTGNVETIGTLTFSGGRNVITLQPGTGNEVQINSAIARSGTVLNGTGLLRGGNLGSTGVGTTRFVLPNTSILVGGNGADGTTTKSIIPFLVGDTDSAGAGTGFLTHDATNGLRLLAPSEYAPTIAGTQAQRNVSTAGGETVSSNVSLNSLRFTGGATTIASGTRVGISGAPILFTGTATLNGAGYLDAGAGETIISIANNTVSTASVNARLAGSGGVTLSSMGATNIIELGGDNDIAGIVYVNTGTVRLTNPKALNSRYPATVTARAGGILQIFGNNVTIRDLASTSGAGVFQNGSATPATLTTYLTGARILSTTLSDGGTGALSLVIGGNTLTAQATNSLTGSLELRGGNLILSGSATGSMNNLSSAQINGGILRLTSITTAALSTRLKDTLPLTFNNGTFDFDQGAGAANYSETTGAVSLASGANVITVDKASSGQTSAMTFASLARSTGATVNFTSQNNGTAIFDLGATSQSRLVFTAAPTLDDGIIGGWATIDSSATTREFAKYVSTGTISATALVAGDYTTTLASGANAAQNVKITATPTALSANSQINSLNLAQASAATVALGGNTLRVESGGIIVSGAFNAAISGGTLTAGTGNDAAGELIFHTMPATTNPVAVTATIADNGVGAVSLVKTGPGLLDLTGASNTYTGRTYVNGGTLRFGADANFGATPAAQVADSINLSGGATLETQVSQTLNANRGLTVGPGSNIISMASGTAGAGKTLTYNGAINSLGTTEGSLQFKNNIAASTGVDPGKFTGTLSALNVNGSFRLDTGTVTVNSPTSVIGRSLQVITDGTGSLTYTGGGTLTVGKGITDTLDVGVNQGDVIVAVATLNLSGLSQFTANVDTVRVGRANANFSGQGTLTLATNNDIVAGTSIIIGDTSNAGNLVSNLITFGSGTNNVTTKSLTVGGNKSRADLKIVSGGTLNLNGFGANTVDLLVGNYGNTGTTGGTGNFDLTGGTLVASLNTLVVGQKTAGSTGGIAGIVTLTGTGNNITANSVTLGRVDAASAANTNVTAGTLNFGGGTFTVAGDVSLGLWSNNSTFLPKSNGTLNLTGGTFTVGGNILTTIGNTNATANLTLGGGLLDMTAGNITVDSLTVNSGGLKDVNQIFGGDGTTPLALTKSTNGVVRILGTNAYTGATNISAGTVILGGSISGTTSLSVAVGAELRGAGSINPAATVTSAGFIDGGEAGVGTATGSFDFGNLILNGGTIAADLVSGAVYDHLNVQGTLSLNAPIVLQLNFNTPFAEGTAFRLIDNDGSEPIALASSGFTAGGTPITPDVDFYVTSGGVTQTFRLTYAGGDLGNDVVLTAVPEPTPASALLIGTAALAGLQRFRRRVRAM